MRVAVVHYHLKPGGVTRVIENTVAALADRDVEVVVLSGEPYEGGRVPRVAVVEGLGYQAEVSADAGGKLTHAMIKAARDALGGLPDVWHIHNPTLGKNVAFTQAVAQLAEAGHRMVLQAHDFAEDGRPGNYRVLRAGAGDAPLYVDAAHVHWAALNGRDAGFLRRLGAPFDRVHLLANPVSVPDEPLQALGDRRPAAEASRLFLYPTRAIRRKNLGEILLLSALGDEGDLFATTMEPDNPVWQPIHARWVAMAKDLGLPFAAGVVPTSDFGFLDWIARADALVTTSVAEGFGLAFLEPCVFGKEVLGRDLPEVTDDFRGHHIDLGELYGELPVPLNIVGEADLRSTLQTGLEPYYGAYERALPDDAAHLAFEAVTADGQVDFGALDETLQERALRAVATSHELRQMLMPRSLHPSGDERTVEVNRRRVAEAYSLSRYGDTLEALYAQVASTEVEAVQGFEAGRLLDCFLDPARFRLLRS